MKQKKISCISWLVLLGFLLSLLPVFYLAGYVHATGDDYHYGAMAHWAWQDTHSLWQTLKASAENTIAFWHGWQGTWFTIFWMGLQPEVFSPNAYWIVPIFMVGINVLCTSVLTHYCMIQKLGLPAEGWIVTNAAVLFLSLQFIPSTKSGIFWWNGTAHYIIPYCLAMLSVWCFFRFIDTYRIRFGTGALLCMTALGGSSYLAALFAPIVLVALLLIYAKSRRKSLWLLVCFGAEMAGLMVSASSPGNAIRGGESFGFSASRAVETILQSFLQGMQTILQYVEEKPFVFVILILTAVFLWNLYCKMETMRFSFRWPFLFVAFLFCLWCAMFAPGIYAGVEVSGGVPNTIFQVFVLTAMAAIVYTLGWVRVKLGTERAQKEWKIWRNWIFVSVAFLCLLTAGLQKGTLKETTFFNCLSYIASGRADDYKSQMQERLEILLDDSKKDIELPEMNSDQGPFMHMEIMEDPESWTNTVMCEFYRKDRVVRVGREH